jgi:hypothetical protein
MYLIREVCRIDTEQNFDVLDTSIIMGCCDATNWLVLGSKGAQLFGQQLHKG